MPCIKDNYTTNKLCYATKYIWQATNNTTFTL